MIVDASIILGENNIFNSVKNSESLLVIGQVQSGKTEFMIENTKEAFSIQNYDYVIIIGGTNNLLLGQTDSRFIKEFRELNVEYLEIKYSKYNDMPNGKVLISTLKAKNQLEKVISLMKYSWDKKVLIIDDESDYGGINTSNEEEEPTPMHVLIKKLVKSIKRGFHISITATPFADILSKSSSFNKIYIIKPKNGYKGLQYFLEKKDEFYIKTIVTKNIREINDCDIQWFEILKEHIKRVLESKLDSSQLLINNSLKNNIHEKIYEIFEKNLEVLSSYPLDGWFDFNQEEDSDKLKKYSNIIKEMKNNIFCLNKNNSKWNRKSHSIIIGGANVSRGYTFQKLITTVMFNESEGKLSADTLLQRCRWFGYREEISKYMKIYCSERIIKSLEECQILLRIIEENYDSLENIKKEMKLAEFDYIEPTGKIKGNLND